MEGLPSVIVKVGNGDGTTIWRIPKDLLTHVSPFFNAALNQPWAEATTESVELKEDHPTAFRLFIHWLYTWVVSTSSESPEPFLENLDVTISLHAWVLGDKLGCPRFQDFAMGHLWARRLWRKDIPDVVGYAYANTSADSKLRQWAAWELLDWTKSLGTASSEWIQLAQELNGLAIDLVKIQMRNPNAGAPQVHDFLIVEYQNGYDAEDVSSALYNERD